MSFSMEFTATTKGRALKLLEEKGKSLPIAAVQFLRFGIEQLRPAGEDAPRAIRVRAVGHLCDSGSSYQASTADLSVTPVDLDV